MEYLFHPSGSFGRASTSIPHLRSLNIGSLKTHFHLSHGHRQLRKLWALHTHAVGLAGANYFIVA